MNVTLSPETEKFINSQIQAGLFSSPDQLLEEAVRGMMIEDVDVEELDADTKAAIERAEAQFERGEWTDFDTVAAEMRKRMGRA